MLEDEEEFVARLDRVPGGRPVELVKLALLARSPWVVWTACRAGGFHAHVTPRHFGWLSQKMRIICRALDANVVRTLAVVHFFNTYQAILVEDKLMRRKNAVPSPQLIQLVSFPVQLLVIE